MPDMLHIRTYNVRFGDAILISVPDRDPATNKMTTRHILIDVGNVLNKEGGEDTVFKPVVDDVIREFDGRPLDLYVMTHEPTSIWIMCKGCSTCRPRFTPTASSKTSSRLSMRG